MTVVKGEFNSWQTGEINGEPHAIEMCGARTGHAVRAVAFCDKPETAMLLVSVLALLKQIHANWLDPSKAGRSSIINQDMLDAKALLERAGLVE